MPHGFPASLSAAETRACLLDNPSSPTYTTKAETPAPSTLTHMTEEPTTTGGGGCLPFFQTRNPQLGVHDRTKSFRT